MECKFRVQRHHVALLFCKCCKMAARLSTASRGVFLLYSALAEESVTYDDEQMSLFEDDTPAEVGRFHILWELARGGMGVVYRAFDPLLQRVVAIKIIQSRFASDDGTKFRFLEESQITAKLQHPGVPPVYDGGELPDGRPYLAMKLIKGQTLAQQLKARSALGEQRGQFLQVFESIAQTVGFAHANGVIHRDLKPANIMVGAYGEVQVMDWGLARSAEREEQKKATDDQLSGGAIFETMEGAMLGTPAFAAPEQARGELDRVDERADVFGLGGLLCMILAGVPPFLGTDVKSTLALAIVGDISEAVVALHACGAEPELVDLCLKCLASDLEQRPRNGTAVASAVAEFRASSEARSQAALVERAKAETEALAQRKRQRLLFSVLGVLSVLMLLAAWQWFRATVATGEATEAKMQTDTALDRVTKEKQATAEALDVATEARRKMFLSVRRVHAEYANEMNERPRLQLVDGKKYYTTRQTYDLEILRPLWMSFQESPDENGRRSAMAIEAELRLAAIEIDLGQGDQALNRYRSIERELSELVNEEPSFDHRLLLAYWHRGLADIYDQKFDYAQSIAYYAQAAKQAEELSHLDVRSVAADRLTVLCLWEMANIAERGVSDGLPSPAGMVSPTDIPLAALANAKLLKHIVWAMPQTDVLDGSSESRSFTSVRQRVAAHALDGLLRCWKTTPTTPETWQAVTELAQASRTWKRGTHTNYEILVRSELERCKRLESAPLAEQLFGYERLLKELGTPEARGSRMYDVQDATELSLSVLLEFMRALGKAKDVKQLKEFGLSYSKGLDKLTREIEPTPEIWVKNTSADLQIFLSSTLARFELSTIQEIDEDMKKANGWLATFKKMKPGEAWQHELGLLKECEARLAKSRGDLLAVRKALDEWQANGLLTEVLINHVRWHGWLVNELVKTTSLGEAKKLEIRKDSLARTTFMIGLIAKHDPLSLPKLFEDAEIAPLRKDEAFQRELDKHKSVLLRSLPNATTPGQQPSQR